MDKLLFNFSVRPHSQKDQYVGGCAEFSFLSYSADTDLGAYQGICRLVCDFEEHIDQLSNEQEFNGWFATKAQVAIDDTRSSIPFKQVLKEVCAFVAKRENQRFKTSAAGKENVARCTISDY